MGRLFTGISILLFVLVVGFIIALANSEDLTQVSGASCSSGNATQCAEESQDDSDFLDTLRDIQPFTIEGAPDEVNIILASLLVVIIVGAIITIAYSFIPFTAE